MIDVIASAEAERIIRDTIATMGHAVTAACDQANLVVRGMEPGEKWADVVRVYGRDRGLNDHCLGLYDPERTMVVLRNVAPFVIAHEISHHIDLSLGDPAKMRYRSEHDDTIKAAFRARRGDMHFVSLYASVAQTEFVAESFRALYGFSARQHPGRADDLARLRRIDPAMMDILDGWRRELDARFGPVAPPAIRPHDRVQEMRPRSLRRTLAPGASPWPGQGLL
jgi:hypothetical protein